MKKKKKLSRKAAAAAAVASAGVMMAGLFSTTDELLQETDLTAVSPGVTDLYVPGADGGDPDEGDPSPADEEAPEEERRRGGPRARLRAAIRSLPVGVRAAVGVPLWAVGRLILSALSALWAGVLSPAAGTVLRWVVTAALILLGIALVGKAAFPELPLRKLLNRRTVSGTLIALAVFGAADAVLPLVWDGYGTLADVLRLAVPTAVFAAAAILLLRREQRKRRRLGERAEREAEKAADMPAALTQEEALREVLALADSVK